MRACQVWKRRVESARRRQQCCVTPPRRRRTDLISPLKKRVGDVQKFFFEEEKSLLAVDRHYTHSHHKLCISLEKVLKPMKYITYSHFPKYVNISR